MVYFLTQPLFTVSHNSANSITSNKQVRQSVPLNFIDIIMESVDAMQNNEIGYGKVNPTESLENSGSNSKESLSIVNIDEDSELTQRFHVGMIIY